MKIIKYISSYLYISVCSYASIVEFNSVRPTWEIQYQNSTVSKYSAGQLVKQFEGVRIPGTKVPAIIHDALEIIVSNAVGRSLIEDIVSALEPKINYAASLRNIINHIDSTKTLNAERALRIAFGLIKSMNPNALINSTAFNAYLSTELGTWLDALYADPKRIIENCYMGDLFTTDYLNGVDFLYNKLNSITRLVEGELNKCRFQFNTNIDGYDHISRTISIKDLPTSCSVVSGPRLNTFGCIVGIIMKDREFLSDERLFHEILHYNHITLRREYCFDTFECLGRSLITHGFNPSYTGILRSLWTNEEEFRTITGIFSHPDSKQLCFEKHSESRYLCCKEKSFRCSHSTSYCTKVPKYFIEIICKTGINLYYFPGEDRDVSYIKQHDELI